MYLEPFVGFLILANGILIGLQTDPQLTRKDERARMSVLRLLSKYRVPAAPHLKSLCSYSVAELTKYDPKAMHPFVVASMVAPA